MIKNFRLYDIEDNEYYKFLTFNKMIDFAHGLNSVFKISVEVRKDTWVDIDEILTIKNIDDLKSGKKALELLFQKSNGKCELVLLKYDF